jgi:hypothetical protein
MANNAHPEVNVKPQSQGQYEWMGYVAIGVVVLVVLVIIWRLYKKNSTVEEKQDTPVSVDLPPLVRTADSCITSAIIKQAPPATISQINSIDPTIIDDTIIWAQNSQLIAVVDANKECFEGMRTPPTNTGINAACEQGRKICVKDISSAGESPSDQLKALFNILNTIPKTLADRIKNVQQKIQPQTFNGGVPVSPQFQSTPASFTPGRALQMPAVPPGEAMPPNPVWVPGQFLMNTSQAMQVPDVPMKGQPSGGMA